MKKQPKKTFVVLGFLLFTFLVLSFVGTPFLSLLIEPKQIINFIGSSGTFGPFLIMLLQVLQVIFVPIPGQLTGIISGYFFGVFWGTFYSMIGLTLGSLVAFTLSRKFGKPFVESFVPKKILEKFSFISEGTKVYGIFLIFLLPMFPDDAICFLSGLTKIKIRTLVVIAIVGRLPGTLIANMIGNGVAVSQVQSSLVIVALAGIITIVMYKNKNKIEAYLNKII
ncbi:MAG: VTT domain-containing protein [Patescibacteria group bacterium]|nr:VTT domain-containing protein [Patescibacteria group bacterium]